MLIMPYTCVLCVYMYVCIVYIYIICERGKMHIIYAYEPYIRTYIHTSHVHASNVSPHTVEISS